MVKWCENQFSGPSDPNSLKVLTLKRKKITAENRREQLKLLHQFHEVMKNWKGELPNLRKIFWPEEIDWHLSDSIKYLGKECELIIEFVARTGYKDKAAGGKQRSLRTTPVHYADSWWHDFSNESMRDLFQIYDRFEVNYTNEGGITHFHVACKYDCVEAVEKFLKKGQDPDSLWPKTSDPLLHLAVERGHQDIVRLLLKYGADPNKIDEHKRTPLHVLGKTKHEGDKGSIIFETFFDMCDQLNQEVHIDARDEWGYTPLLVALNRCNNKVAELLFRNGAESNVAESYGYTPLHLICSKPNDDECAKLLKTFFDISDKSKRPIDLDAVTDWGWTALNSAVRHEFYKTAELLVRRGADPNVIDKYRSHALHAIVEKGTDDDETARFLEVFFKIYAEKNQMVLINARDFWGQTPLHIALYRVRRKMVESLLRNGADPNLTNENGRTPLHVMCECKKDEEPTMEMLQIFFDLCDEVHLSVEVDTLDQFGETPLHSSLNNDNKKMAELLLRRGADPYLVNKRGCTLLHSIVGYAVKNLDSDFVETFFKMSDEVDRVVQVDARNKSGETPLQIALNGCNKEVAEILLKRGAQINLADEDGMTYLHNFCQSRTMLSKLKTFFEIDDKFHKKVQVDARDKRGWTPLQLAVVNLLPDVIDLLLDRGADLSSFVFPSESDFDESFERMNSRSKIELAGNALAVVENLEKRGYELYLSDALAIMKLFAKYGMFEKSEGLRNLFERIQLSREAKQVMISYDVVFDDDVDTEIEDDVGEKESEKDQEQIEVSNEVERSEEQMNEIPNAAEKVVERQSLSLHDLIRLKPTEAAKLFQYSDYLDLARSTEFKELSKHFRKACAVHLYEKMSRGFFWSCALESFLDLTQYRPPIPCCEKIFKDLNNEDLYNICLAAENRCERKQPKHATPYPKAKEAQEMLYVLVPKFDISKNRYNNIDSRIHY
ncbi:tankyrase-like [Trichogramma pretiosum]|uniref:tankyrase-like n=1 Tax=Trichogramma pretiosum TaxID=7493 RepID=UPI000C719B9B|nr:tankyrase-like [Trichogramma pretiosum]